MAGRPDFDEFLTALNGFLDKKVTVPQDPSYLRFLEIFCRSVGSSEGHLLEHLEGKGLQSIVAFGMPSTFEKDFNGTAPQALKEPSPLDSAFRDQQVMAVVELKRGVGIPLWFMDIAGKYKFKSLVAVPLIGQTKPVGVLCAYYRDVCLFDQGTLDRLMTIGRMVGTAMEKTMSAGGATETDHATPAVDGFLQLLTTQTTTKAHIFEALTKILVKNLQPSGIISGPLRVVGQDLILSVSDGTGVPPNALGQRYPLPPLLAKKLLLPHGSHRIEMLKADEWGQLRPLMSGKSATVIAQPIIWQKQPQGAIVVWRSEAKPFTDVDDTLLSRLAGITSLALRTN